MGGRSPALLHCLPDLRRRRRGVLIGARDGAVAGVGHGADTLAVRHRRELTSFAARGRPPARRTPWPARPERIDLAEVHDAFAPFD